MAATATNNTIAALSTVSAAVSVSAAATTSVSMAALLVQVASTSSSTIMVASVAATSIVVGTAVGSNAVFDNNREKSKVVAHNVSVAPSSSPIAALAPNITSCERPDEQEGRMTMLLDGISRKFEPNEQEYLQNEFLTAYNKVSLGCQDRYKRSLVNATLAEVDLLLHGDGTGSYARVEFVSRVKCVGCPANYPLFDFPSIVESTTPPNGRSRNLEEIVTNSTNDNGTLDFWEFLEEFNQLMIHGSDEGMIESSFSAIIEAVIPSSTEQDVSEHIQIVHPTSNPSTSPSLLQFPSRTPTTSSPLSPFQSTDNPSSGPSIGNLA